MKTVLLTGGAGFIGSNLVRHLLAKSPELRIVNIDNLSYAGDLESLDAFSQNPNLIFENVDIGDQQRVAALFTTYKPTHVMHLAAESHVDRSISNSGAFIHSNIQGTYSLLEGARNYYNALKEEEKSEFKFLHVSTDEVYGHLGPIGYFTENSPYDPSSPYSASKAASDHLVRAWHRTYGVPTLVTNCSNNYGPWQFPEKLIPVIINKALRHQPIPIYGKGENIRDWLHVEDHCSALCRVIESGTIGQTYLVGGHGERTNLQVAQTICQILNDLVPSTALGDYSALITFVSDRPGHDFRYAIDPTKIQTELGWKASHSFEEGLRSTVEWYIKNQKWCTRLLEKDSQ
jgi:dTDP-glucose 4,6-dehydratase